MNINAPNTISQPPHGAHKSKASRGATAPLLLALAAVLVPMLLFEALAEDVWERHAFQPDIPTLQWLHAHSSPFLDALMLRATFIGGTSVALPLAAMIGLGLWLAGRRREALFGTIGVGGACVIDLVAKAVFHRARPHLWLSIAPQHDYGFPSGHAMLSSSIVAVLLFLLWRSRAVSRSALGRTVQVLGTLAGVGFVLLVGVSRLYLGVHYPSDVLAGWAASLAWVSSVHLIFVTRPNPHWLRGRA